MLLLSAVAVMAQEKAASSSSSSHLAPASWNDCRCQCKALYYISGGVRHGNCLTHYQGAYWCYVKDAATSTCPDMRRSSVYPGERWSFRACTTPSSHQCYGIGGGYRPPYRPPYTPPFRPYLRPYTTPWRFPFFGRNPFWSVSNCIGTVKGKK